ncbi:MAG: type II secretion system protein [Kiritimatiellia bacterium]
MNTHPHCRKPAARGFTLVELLVVIGMLMLLMGSVTSAIVSAQKRAKIAQATTAVKEMTNAILAYENYADTHDLSTVASGGWKEADEATLGFILGKKSNKNGPVPVLYNAAVKGGKILDPWNRPYRVQIKQGTIQVDSGTVLQGAQRTAVAFPNFYRRQAGE